RRRSRRGRLRPAQAAAHAGCLALAGAALRRAARRASGRDQRRADRADGGGDRRIHSRVPDSDRGRPRRPRARDQRRPDGPADAARLRRRGGAVRVRDRLLLRPGARRAPPRAVGGSQPRRAQLSAAGGRPARGLAVLALLCCAAAIALSACGTKQDVLSAGKTKPFTLALDFFPNADHAAIYAAIAHGDFRAAGLDVRPETPSDPAAPLKLLAAGSVDMAVSYEPELLLARDQGLKLVSVAALVQRPLTSIIALPRSHVRKVADLAGKTVGTAGIPYQTAELQTALQSAGVKPARVRQVNVGFNLVPAMLSGKVAATLGGFWNYEALQLAQLHKRPVTIPVDQAGVPEYDELILVARQDEARSRGQEDRKSTRLNSS